MFSFAKLLCTQAALLGIGPRVTAGTDVHRDRESKWPPPSFVRSFP